MECLDPTTATGLANGELQGPDGDAARAHLAECEKCRLEVADLAELRTRTASPGARALAAAAAEPTTLPRGTVVGRYVLFDAVGQGGMGVVYAAYDPELDRKVALKLLHAEVAGEGGSDGHARLLREAQAMARLAHPNVVAVHDVGSLGKRVFMAMEFVEGIDLKAWLAARPRGWREVLEVFAAAGHGLAAAHAAHLVHRDFKPANVLLGTDGRVRVTDFGVARSDAAPLPEALHSTPPALASTSGRFEPLTQAGMVVGTPAYMSPEQLAGKTPDARTDQFSFCLSLYEGLYGQRPFEGLKRSERKPLPRGAKVPTWLRAAVLKGLDPDPDRRHPSMGALLEALGKDPTVARRRWAIIAAVGALVVAGGATVWRQASVQQGLCRHAEQKLGGVWDDEQRRRGKQAFEASGLSYAAASWAIAQGALDAQARGWVEMHQEACEATRVRGEQSDEVLSRRMLCLEQRLQELRSLGTLLARADAALVKKSSDAVAALSPLGECANVARLLAQEAGPHDEVARRQVEALALRLADAKVLLDVGRFEEGAAVAKEVEALAAAVGWRPLLADALQASGWLLDKQGDFKAAEAKLEEAVWLAESSRNDLALARAATRLVFVDGAQLQKPDEARRWARHARAALDRVGDDPQLQGIFHSNLGSALKAEGKLQQATEEYELGLAADVRAHGEVHKDVAVAHSNLCAVLSERQLSSQALVHCQQALELFGKTVGLAHPSVGILSVNLSSALAGLGRSAEAEAGYRQGVAVLMGALGPRHSDTAMGQGFLGQFLVGRGKYREAAAVLREAIATREANLGPDDDFAAECRLALGRAQVSLGEGEGLVQLKALALAAPTPARLEALGVAELELGHLDRASAALEQGLKLAMEDNGPEAQDEFQAALASLELARGNATAAANRLKAVLARHQTDAAPEGVWLVPELTLLGRAQRQAGQGQDARTTLERARSLAPDGALNPEDEAELVFELAMARGQADDARAAREQLGRAEGEHRRRLAAMDAALQRH